MSHEFRLRDGRLVGGMPGAFGLRFMSLLADNCRVAERKSRYSHWIPFRTRRPKTNKGFRSDHPPFACEWSLPFPGRDLESSPTPHATYTTQDAAMAACSRLYDACHGVRSGTLGTWTLRRGALVASADPRHTLLIKSKCIEIRRRSLWNESSCGSCAGTELLEETCEHSVAHCQARCSDVPACNGVTCHGTSKCECLCSLCNENILRKGHDCEKMPSTVRSWVRSDVLEAATPFQYDYRNFIQDVSVSPKAVLQKLADIHECDLVTRS